DGLAAVRGEAAHDGHERAVGAAFAVVDGLAFADAGEELVVLVLVHVGGFAGVLPGLDAAEVHEPVDLGEAGDMGHAFGGVDVVGVVVGATVDLAAGEDAAPAALELVDDGEVVVGVAGLGAGAGGAPAQGGAAERELVAHGPLEAVHRVHGLLDEV